ncbi:hypothetical protein Tco_0633270 [Tanacetum coccineum]
MLLSNLSMIWGYPKAVRHSSDVVTNDMFQLWRALTTIIKLCLTGKTSGFERPRAPVLQILWGVINRAHINYAERMFTKLIIVYLQRKHKFHPRPGSPIHLPNEEPVLGYLKFSAKGTKREVFGMPIPNDLITDDIRETSNAPSPAKRSKAGKVVKKRTKKSSLLLVDEFVDEGVPERLNLDTKEKEPCRSVIFQRHTSTQTEPTGHDESSSLYAELGLTDTEEPAMLLELLSSLQIFDTELASPISSFRRSHRKTNLRKLILKQSLSTCLPLAGSKTPLPTNTATQTSTTTTTTTTLPPIPPQPQQGSSNSILIKCIGELEQHMADMVEANQALEERLDKQGSILYKRDNLNIPHQVSKAVDEIDTDAVDWAIQAPLRDHFRDLPEADMKEILTIACGNLIPTKLMKITRSRRKKKKRRDSPKTSPGSPPHQPPLPPPPAGSSGTPRASGSSQLPLPPPSLYTNQSDQSTSIAAPKLSNDILL